MPYLRDDERGPTDRDRIHPIEFVLLIAIILVLAYVGMCFDYD